MDVVIDFPAPQAEERRAILSLHLPGNQQVDAGFLDEVAYRCALTGGQIRNAVLHASLMALDQKRPIGTADLEAAIQREYRKSGAVCPLRGRKLAAVAMG
jgi:ATP-dependent 26S proteasome regulatory subunit